MDAQQIRDYVETLKQRIEFDGRIAYNQLTLEEKKLVIDSDHLQARLQQRVTQVSNRVNHQVKNLVASLIQSGDVKSVPINAEEG